jgi:hypothetical protein
MSSINLAAFQRFAHKNRSKFKQISSASGREHSVGDVENDSFVIAFEVAARDGREIDFDDPDFQERVITFLYQRLVKYTDKKVRKAVRLDKPIDGEDISADDHPALREWVITSGSTDPLQELILLEESASTARQPNPHASRASAYVHLLQQFNNSMREVAQHLLISLSYCYLRVNEAKRLVELQAELPQTVEDASFKARTWRPFQLKMPRVQLELDLRQPCLAGL